MYLFHIGLMGTIYQFSNVGNLKPNFKIKKNNQEKELTKQGQINFTYGRFK